jgi:hypothetical protein
MAETLGLASLAMPGVPVSEESIVDPERPQTTSTDRWLTIITTSRRPHRTRSPDRSEPPRDPTVGLNERQPPNPQRLSSSDAAKRLVVISRHRAGSLDRNGKRVGQSSDAVLPQTRGRARGWKVSLQSR